MNQFKLTAIAAFYLSAAHMLPAHSSDAADLAEGCNEKCRLSYLDCKWRCDTAYCSEQCDNRLVVCVDGCPTGEGICTDDVTLKNIGRGGVEPFFEGGMLNANGDYESSDDEYRVDFPNIITGTGGNRINNNGFYWSFSGNFLPSREGAEGGGLKFLGSGITEMSGNNTYEGDTVIEQGTLRLGSPTGIPETSSTSVNSGATLDLNDQLDISIASLTLKGGTLQNSGDGAGSLCGDSSWVQAARSMFQIASHL